MKIGKIVISMLLIISMFSSFTAIEASNFEPTDANTVMGVTFNKTYLEVGDTFNATFYLNTSTDTADTFVIHNVTYNGDRLGIVNCTGTNISGTWWGDTRYPTLWTNVTWDNAVGGNISGPQSFEMDGITGNYTAFRANFTALYPGTLYINFSNSFFSANGIQVQNGGVDVVNHTINGVIKIYPCNPASLTATMINYTIINLSWTKGTGDDNVTLCGNTSHYPTSPADAEVLYNGSNLSYSQTGLTDSQTWYYRAWGWNATTQMHSFENITAFATTQSYSNISFSGITPTNGSTYTNCTYTITPNVTITDSKGKVFNYWINASNGQKSSGTGVTNGSKTVSLTGLSHNTPYWWNVTASEQTSGDSISAQYWLMTGTGGGTAPTGGAITPTSGSTSVSPYSVPFSVVVTDVNGDPMYVAFYWSNGSFIGADSSTVTGGTAAYTFSDYSLATNTTYQWFAKINDTANCSSTRVPSSGYYNFKTDANIITISKVWQVHANNTIQEWINITNVGEMNLTTGYINNTYSYANLIALGSNPEASGLDPGRINVTWLNMTGYPGHWFNTTYWFNLSGAIANGTTLSDTAKVVFNGTTINTYTITDLPTMCFYVVKSANMSVIYWNSTSVNFTINITNCGDFYLNWFQINETYSANLTYDSSNLYVDSNATYNVTTIAPGETYRFWIRMNVTSSIPVNGTRIYNNVTGRCNESTTLTTASDYMQVGAVTTAIRIIYNAKVTEVLDFGTTIIGIIGVILIIGAILLIVNMVRGGGVFGQGE